MFRTLRTGRGFPRPPRRPDWDSQDSSIHPPREEGRAPTSLQHGIQTLTLARSLARSFSVPLPSSPGIAIRAHHNPSKSSTPDTTEQSGHGQAPERQTDRDGREKARVREEEKSAQEGEGEGEREQSSWPLRIVTCRGGSSRYGSLRMSVFSI